MGVQLAVIYSDTHCGSKWGLMNPEATDEEGTPLGMNPVQQWLWDCFKDSRQWVWRTCGTDPYALIINGDLIDGDHHGTKEIVSKEVGVHCQIAVDCFKPLAAAAAHTFVVEGTNSHTGNKERSIGAALGAVCDPRGAASWKELPLEIHGCYGIVRHHLGATARPYLEGSQLSINIGVEIQEAARHGDRIPKWFARAHRHRHGKFEDGHALMVVTGGWQGASRWLKQAMPAAVAAPSVWILDWRDKEEGELPDTRYRIYEPESFSNGIVRV